MATILKNHYVLAVPDAVTTARFFIDVLGFDSSPVADDGWRFVSKDNLLVMLGTCPDAIPPVELGDHSYFAYLVVDDVDGYYDDIKAKDAATFSVPTSQPWGMREFGLVTPDGHRIMIGQKIDE
ncbi:MAG: VOC family protein [Planctomycetaceae bacterium]|nr:VOC family protein [Planctomycetaceae bacterium]